MSETLRSVGLFAGIGGFERGFSSSGIEPELFCEIDCAAQHVLRNRFRGVRIADDITKLKSIPSVDVVAAGFPCQDLSQVGKMAGLDGKKSILVNEVIRLIKPPSSRPRWIVLENVPFMLRLNRGMAIDHIVKALESAGYRWAYRTVDTRSFGIPHRRLRVIIVASATEDPSEVLFSDNVNEQDEFPTSGDAYGFYWTEGNRGVGWAVEAIPALKPGSTLSIPSPPAIWMSQAREIITPGLRDAERLQGFPENWTALGEKRGTIDRRRWRLVGNAVSVPVARWVGRRLVSPGSFVDKAPQKFGDGDSWPSAAWGANGKRYIAKVSIWPTLYKRSSLNDFLKNPTKMLSMRATKGFLERAKASKLRFANGFLEDVAHHLDVISAASQ